jgi:hypothetical protein
MTLDAGEFIRRFLVHVLPEGFQRIRYYGFMGNRYRKQKLARCRELLGMQQSDMPIKPKQGRDYRDKVEELTRVSLRECPFCRQGQMVCIELLAPVASQDPPFSGHFMTVGIFQSLIIVLAICQGRQQASHCHACDTEPSKRRRRRSFRPGDHISIRMFRHQDRTQHVPEASARALCAGMQHPISIAAPAR